MALFTRVEKLVRTELSVTAEVEEEGTGKSKNIFVEIRWFKSSIRIECEQKS